MQFPSITIDPEWCPAECLGRHVALSAPGTRGMNLWELQMHDVARATGCAMHAGSVGRGAVSESACDA